MSGRTYIDKQHREAYRALVATAGQVREAAAAAGLDRILMELVNVRISQLNGCAYCLDLHTRLALEAGESPRRLAVLPAWRDTEVFDATEQAALALAEAVTELPPRAVRAAVFDELHGALTEEQFSVISWAAVTMNAFNRVSIVSGHPVRTDKSAR